MHSHADAFEETDMRYAWRLASLCLIRPDQHIAWRGNKLAEEPALIIRKVTGYDIIPN